jgi:hypothetical protein
LLQYIEAFAAGATLDSGVESAPEIGLPIPELERALRAQLAGVLRVEASQPA